MPTKRNKKFSEEDIEVRNRQLLREYLPKSQDYITSYQKKGFITSLAEGQLSSFFQDEYWIPTISLDSIQHIITTPKGKNLVIQSLHHPSLKLVSPIWVYLEHDGEQFIASSSDFNNIYGEGDDENEALEDLRESIAELYFELKDKKLGKGLKKIFTDLQSIIKER